MKSNEKRIAQLEDIAASIKADLEVLQGKTESWVLDSDLAKKVAGNMDDAFAWDRCPYSPADFGSWDEMYDFFKDIESY